MLSTLILNGIINLALLLPTLNPKAVETFITVISTLAAFMAYWFTQKERIMSRISEHSEKHRDIEKQLEYLQGKHKQYDEAISKINSDIQEIKGDNKVMLTHLSYIVKKIDE